MYVYDAEFKKYTSGAIDEFIERFVVRKLYRGKAYKINDIEYYKYDDGREYWYKNNCRHRESGPAIICRDESQYYINGKLHNENAPAVIGRGGFKQYWQNGVIHRLGGPAVIYSNGTEEYWQNGKRM